MAPKFNDTEREAIARAINADGLTAAQATDLARSGELGGSPAFDMAQSTARDVAAQARRGSPEMVGAQRAPHNQLFDAGLDLLTGQLEHLMEIADERDLNNQELTRMAKIFRALNVLVEGDNARRLRAVAPDAALLADHEPQGPRSQKVERMLAALDQGDGSG